MVKWVIPCIYIYTIHLNIHPSKTQFWFKHNMGMTNCIKCYKDAISLQYMLIDAIPTPYASS